MWQCIADVLPLPAVVALSQTNKVLRGAILGSPAAPSPVARKLQQHALFYGKAAPPAYAIDALSQRIYNLFAA